MGIRRGKKERKAYEMSRGKKSDFERVEEERILRLRNENQVKTRKIKCKIKKEEKAGGRVNGVGEKNSKI